jgi:hypothetical protein
VKAAEPPKIKWAAKVGSVDPSVTLAKLAKAKAEAEAKTKAEAAPKKPKPTFKAKQKS